MSPLAEIFSPLVKRSSSKRVTSDCANSATEGCFPQERTITSCFVVTLIAVSFTNAFQPRTSESQGAETRCLLKLGHDIPTPEHLSLDIPPSACNIFSFASLAVPRGCPIWRGCDPVPELLHSAASLQFTAISYINPGRNVLELVS